MVINQRKSAPICQCKWTSSCTRFHISRLTSLQKWEAGQMKSWGRRVVKCPFFYRKKYVLSKNVEMPKTKKTFLSTPILPRIGGLCENEHHVGWWYLKSISSYLWMLDVSHVKTRSLRYYFEYDIMGSRYIHRHIIRPMQSFVLAEYDNEQIAEAVLGTCIACHQCQYV